MARCKVNLENNKYGDYAAETLSMMLEDENNNTLAWCFTYLHPTPENFPNSKGFNRESAKSIISDFILRAYEAGKKDGETVVINRLIKHLTEEPQKN